MKKTKGPNGAASAAAANPKGLLYTRLFAPEAELEVEAG